MQLVRDESIVILSPELLSLLQKHARLDRRVLFFGMLESPPFTALIFVCEFRKLSAVDTNRDISEFRCVVCDHLSPALLIKLLASHA